jgi:hypothetical protein
MYFPSPPILAIAPPPPLVHAHSPPKYTHTLPVLPPSLMCLPIHFSLPPTVLLSYPLDISTYPPPSPAGSPLSTLVLTPLRCVVYHKDWPLVWSAAPHLPPGTHLPPALAQQLGVRSPPALGVVIAHCGKVRAGWGVGRGAWGGVGGGCGIGGVGYCSSRVFCNLFCC